MMLMMRLKVTPNPKLYQIISYDMHIIHSSIKFEMNKSTLPVSIDALKSPFFHFSSFLTPAKLTSTTTIFHHMPPIIPTTTSYSQAFCLRVIKDNTPII